MRASVFGGPRAGKHSPTSSGRRRTGMLAAALGMLMVPLETPASALQQESVESRLERVAGIQGEAAGVFFETLRRNVGTGDRRSACALVAYPLRQPGGDVADASQCEARYDDIFTIGVRRAVGRQQFKELFVTPDGVAFGVGELWFAAQCRQRPCGDADIRITTINSAPGLRPPKGKVLIACSVPGRAVTVTADGNGGAEFRMRRAEAPAGPPEVEVLRGVPTPEATGPCAWRAWSFDAATRYTVAEVACMPVVVPAPFGTVARVTERTPGAQEESAWCFE